MDNQINIVIGSWGSYNECNDRALGSKWICLNDYEEWSEIEQELTNQGFILNGIDEELFIQDIENYPIESANWDYVHPKELFELLKESEVLDNEYKFKIMQAYLEVRSYRDWQHLVENYGNDWDCDIYLYSNQTLLDVAYNIVDEYYGDMLESPLSNYFDYQKYADDLTYDGYHETSYGVIQIW